MAPLANRTIATVGSGVMAEAMIAGLLRGALVEPAQVGLGGRLNEHEHDIDAPVGGGHGLLSLGPR